MMQKNFVILKLRAALDYPTFPVNPRAFQALEDWLAVILACSLIHGTHWVHQDTFVAAQRLAVVLRVHLGPEEMVASSWRPRIREAQVPCTSLISGQRDQR